MRMRGRINVTPFDNGIYLYSIAHSQMHLSAIGFRSGSIHEPQGLSGINHLMEHLIARRGTNYTGREVERIFNRFMGGTHGPDINIRCDRSSVLFGHGDLRRREYMWKCFDMQADLVKSAMHDAYDLGPRILDAKGLKVEKAAVHNEHRVHGTDHLINHLCDLVHWNLYKSNPARRRIDCARKDLKKIKLADIRQFICDRCITETMFVVLIGPKNNEAVEKVREYFGDLPRHSQIPLTYNHSDDLPTLDGIKSFELVRPGIRQHHIAIAFPTDGYLSKHAVVLDVLAALWEYRIERRLREENTNFNAGVYHPETWVPRTFMHGIIMALFSTVGDNRYTEQAVAMTIEECEKLKHDESVEFKEDCEDRQNYLIDKYDQMLQAHPLNLCEAITEATCNGDPDLKHLISYRRRLVRVTPKQIHEAAQKYFTTPDRFLKIVIKPLIVPQEILDYASDKVRPYLMAINHDPDFSEV